MAFPIVPARAVALATRRRLQVVKPACLQHLACSSSVSSSSSSTSPTELLQSRLRSRQTMQAQGAPVGLLQMPRTRHERWRHLEVLNSVPFDLVPAHEERTRLSASRDPIAGSIGKILRRHRRDTVTTMLNAMLRACVDRCEEPLFWDTVAGSLRRTMSRMNAEDIGLALACLMKANYKRDNGLVEKLVNLLASTVAGTSRGGASIASTRSSDGRLGRVRRRRDVLRPGRTQASKRNTLFSEHALCAGLGAVRHWDLGEVCGDAVARLCTQIHRNCSSISDRTFCRLALHAGGLLQHARRHPPVSAARQDLPLDSRTESGSTSHSGGGSSLALRKLLRRFQSHLCERFSREELVQSVSNLAPEKPSMFVPGDLCLLAHAFGHARAAIEYKDAFIALEKEISDVALLQLSATELAGLANSFSKLTLAEDFNLIRLFDQLGRQLIAAAVASNASNAAVVGASSHRTSSTNIGSEERKVSTAVGLRVCCVALNAFAHASVRHEPLFFALDQLLPQLLNESSCDMRQLAMLAHAHVRVGLSQSDVLPLLWDRARVLASRSDAHSLSLILFAVTKASTVAGVARDGSGQRLLAALSCRLLVLLETGRVEPPALVVTAYSLARSGCALAVGPHLWLALAKTVTDNLDKLSLSEAANMAAALAQAAKEIPNLSATEGDVVTFFDVLCCRIQQEMERGDARNIANTIDPMVAVKLVLAFGDMQRMDARQTIARLARLSLAATATRQRKGGAKVQRPPGVGHLRAMTQALSRLRVQDEDLLLAITAAQRRHCGSSSAKTMWP